MQAFYNGVTQSVRSTIDVAARGTLMKKTKDKANNLIKEMVLNNYQWANEKSQPKRFKGKLELYAIYMLFPKLDVMSQRLE